MVNSSAVREVDATAIRPDADPKLVLGECCSQQTACRFQLVHCEYLVRAIIAAVHDQWVEIHLSWKHGDEPVHTQAIGCISFPFGHSFCAFLACVTDIRHTTSEHLHVFVSTPQRLMVTNLRHKFRVPIVQQAGLETIVRSSSNKEFRVVARDITEQSLEIEFAPGDEHDFHVGSIIQVELRFRGDVVHKSAEVRRILGRRCGLSFRDDTPINGQHTDARLHAIVVALQQVWLKNRLA